MKTKIILVLAVIVMLSFTVGSQGKINPKATNFKPVSSKQTKGAGFEMQDRDQWR